MAWDAFRVEALATPALVRFFGLESASFASAAVGAFSLSEECISTLLWLLEV